MWWFISWIALKMDKIAIFYTKWSLGALTSHICCFVLVQTVDLLATLLQSLPPVGIVRYIRAEQRKEEEFWVG